MVSDVFLMLLDLNQSAYRNLNLCANGDTADEAGNISLFLRVTNAEDTTFNVHYQFGLMNRKDQTIEYLSHVFKQNGLEFGECLGYGYLKMLSHAEFFDASKNYVVDGKLTIACKVS